MKLFFFCEKLRLGFGIYKLKLDKFFYIYSVKGKKIWNKFGKCFKVLRFFFGFFLLVFFGRGNYIEFYCVISGCG